ncbi:synaptopodin-2-like [Silurus asotus]|uniref:Synaptopodin-2-like n=1 Tax=Silurus asotus TaxID=30991 RepID=A0AAD5A5U0_SILAS|nr:synaptopodin-2-like [Silurus asotus]
MSAQDYACVTVRGRAPWGFQLRQNDTQTHRSVQVHQVEEGSHASMAGLCEDDELVSVNGVSCSSLSLAEVIVLIEKATDCLQLLVKRCCLYPQKSQSVNTTLQASWRELRKPFKSEDDSEAHYGKTNRNTKCPEGNTMVRTQFCIPAPKDRAGPKIYDSSDGGPRLEITPGGVVELQLSLSQTTLEDTGCTSLGSACGVKGDLCHKPNTENEDTTIGAPGCSFYIPLHEREPLGQRGVLVSSPSALLGQVDVAIQPLGRDSRTGGVGASGTEATANEQQDYAEGEGGHTDEDPTSFSVSFGIPSEEDSESERELNKPNKHRARHARLRRSESLSDKQVKEAKSKCKRIALLLTTSAANPNNKGLLMFKKHRQRAKQYTIVSYGTGENEPEIEDEENECNDKETHAVEFTVLATSETEIDEDFFTNSSGHKNIVTFDLDTGLLEIERKLHNQEDMNELPETRGKGALMFAQRRQRIDEIAAEHEEMRSKGIPVESVQEADKNYQEGQQYQLQQQQVQPYIHNMNGVSNQQINEMQSSVINRSAKPFSVQSRGEAPYSPSANQGLSYFSDGQGEQIASRDERISVPAIKTGILQDTSRKNKAKPMFSFKEPQKISPNPELLSLLNRNDKKTGFDSGTDEDYLSLGAEACNFLQSTKVKNKTPPPVAPKPHINPVTPPWSPQPEIASQPFHQDAENNIPVTARDTVPEMESSAIPEEEPALALTTNQQEASIQLHSQVQAEVGNAWGLSEKQSGQQIETWHEKQSQSQIHAKPETVVSSWGPSSTQALEQHPITAWGTAEVPSRLIAQSQSQMQPPWVPQSQVLSEVQPPMSVPTQSQPQPSWVTQGQPQHQPHHQSQINTWGTTPTQSPHQPPWAQSQVPEQPSISTWSQDLNQPQVQPPWAQPQQESQPIPSWTASQQHPQSPWSQHQNQPQPQPTWIPQNQQQTLPQPAANTWNQSQSLVQTQPPWTHQAQASSQPPVQMHQQQNPWTSVPPQSQSQPAWAQQPQEHPQTMNSWAPEQNKIQPTWNQPQSPAQAQPPWSHSPQQQTPPQPQSQTLLSTWPPRPQQGPAITMSSTESQKLTQPSKPWSPPQTTQPSSPHQANSLTPRSKVPSQMSKMGSSSGMGSAFEMPALRGKGAELFAKRQSRMEKYVVDSSTVQANKARSMSPTPSLPASWKYSPNCRAPPPLAYNPLQSPSYPLSAIKQTTSSNPALKNKNKATEKDKTAPKPLNVLDVMKHQPYQLKSSLFTYGPAAEKLVAEKEAAEKLAAQKAAEAQAQTQAQAQAQLQAPESYAFIPQQPQQPQQPYDLPAPSPSMHDGPYQHTPNSYQPTPNAYQQVPYQQIYNPPHAYQHPSSNSYQHPPNIPYQQPPPYHAGPCPASQVPCYQPTPASYVVPTCTVAGRSNSATGSSTYSAPKPKFSAKKSDAQALGRSSSLSPPVRLSPLGLASRSASVSPSPTTSSHATYNTRSKERQVFWLEKGRKPLTPWEAASRHPLGLVDEAFADQDMQHSIASNLRSAAYRKMLPEPPAEWKAKVAYEPPPKSQGWRMNQSSLSFLSPTKSTASAPAVPVPYGSPFRQSQPPRSFTEASLGPSMSGQQYRRSLGQSVYRSTYSNTWRW